MDKLVLQSAQIRLRHIALGASTDAGAVSVLGQWFAPQDRQDLNNRRSRFRTGSYVRREGQEGEFTLKFWNTPRNRRRFSILANRSSYQPGDEWIEIYETPGEDAAGDLLFTGTPTKAQVTLTTITLTGYDALWLARKQRDTDAGFWCHAPRDVFEFYCRGWTSPLADDFTKTGRFTFAVGQQTTADGVWNYVRGSEDTGYPANVKLIQSAGNIAYLTGTPTLPDGPTAHWRIETTITQLANQTGVIELHAKGAGGADTAYLSVTANGPLLSLGVDAALSDSAHYAQNLVSATRFYDASSGAPLSFPLTLAIERRGRWYFFYVNGTLILVGQCGAGAGSVTPEIVTGSNTTFWVDSVLARSAQSLLQRSGIGGDLRLPSPSLPGGGLQASYFDDHDLASATSTWPNAVLDPTRDKQGSKVMVMRRLESAITFANAAAFKVPVANDEYFSGRFVGAIYLDLDNADYAFRTTSDDRARVWIGKTRWGEQIIDDWTLAGHSATTATSTWLMAGSSAGSAPSGTSGPLAGQRSGWYPIIVEYSQGTSAGSLTLEMQTSAGVGSWATPASNLLSPYGVVNNQVRGDSHYEQLLGLKAGWGIQFTCQPKSLESGEFPGRVVPLVREGRDTDIVVDAFDGTSPQTLIDAEDTVTALRLDAQGIADPKGTTQLTREAIDYSKIAKHMLVNSEYESLSDITYPPQLEQRGRSILALRSSAYEEIQVQPTGRRGLTDSFPLTGSLAKMNWLPGDGARLRLEELGVEDLTPRQMIDIGWTLRPAGRSRPTVTWRQRTRNWEQLFRKNARVALSNDRNYQSQLTVIPGTLGSSTGLGGVDNYSRVPLPSALSDVKQATVVVETIVGTWTIEINGTSTGITVSAAGRYPVNQYIAKLAGEQRMYARLISGGTSYSLNLELLVAT